MACHPLSALAWPRRQQVGNPRSLPGQVNVTSPTWGLQQPLLSVHLLVTSPIASHSNWSGSPGNTGLCVSTRNLSHTRLQISLTRRRR
jgi:hypothetical protein